MVNPSTSERGRWISVSSTPVGSTVLVLGQPKLYKQTNNKPKNLVLKNKKEIKRSGWHDLNSGQIL